MGVFEDGRWMQTYGGWQICCERLRLRWVPSWISGTRCVGPCGLFLLPVAMDWDAFCEPSAGICWPRAMSSCSSGGVSCGGVLQQLPVPCCQEKGEIKWVVLIFCVVGK